MESINECKDYRINSKANKSRNNKGNSKRQRKSLLQAQQEVLEKNVKHHHDINDEHKIMLKIKNDKFEDIEKVTNSTNSSTSAVLSSPAGHPRNRWRCMQPRVCNYCWKTFSNSFNLKQHIVNVHVQSQGVTCSLCEKVVKNKWYLRKHLVTAHGAPLKRVKGNESGGNIPPTRETVVPPNDETGPTQIINKQVDSIDAAAAVAAVAAAANIPLASFVNAANNISHQHQININNNNC